jgi:ankyrin repeat protein
MRHFMLMAGLGLATLASDACGNGPILPLAVAAARNAAGTVHQLLRQGQSADDRDATGLTALMWAARTGAVDAMRALLDAGADLEVHDRRNGWTALFHAIHKRQAPAVRLLLDRGADPNAAAHLGTTPLMMAAVDADPAIVELLLAHGADPRGRGLGGSTALSQTVSGGALSDIDRPLLGGCHAKTATMLKTHDPAIDLPDTIAGRVALWWARLHGCREVIDLVGADAMRKK